MHEKKEPQLNDTVLEYVKAATSSSDRARGILMVIITASVLVFTAYWNTGGWLDSRLAVRTAALSHFDPNFDPAAVPANKRDLHDSARQLIAVYGWDTRHPGHRQVLENQIEQLSKVQSERFRIIHVPFFGVVFDMNDLGIFAGITFCVALLWLRLSLAREHRNLEIAFEEAGERDRLKLCYELLSMHQVLTVPPIPGQRFRRVWSTISMFLYVIPALVYFVQFRSDWSSRDLGYILSRQNMNRLLVMEAISFTFVLLLSYQCVRLYMKIDHEWTNAFARVYPEARPAEEAPAASPAEGEGGLPGGAAAGPAVAVEAVAPNGAQSHV